MGLYENSVGLPGTLIAYTNAAAIVDGDNRIPVVGPPTPVYPDTYWIAGAFSANARICGDTSFSNKIEYVSISFPGVPNPFGSQPTELFAVHMNLYAVGTE
jgi:hypothetical protein